MPELPEVESVRRQLDPELSGRRAIDVWWDPHPALPRQFHDVARLVDRKIRNVGRRGKFLIAPLDEGLELVMHLGMTGSFRLEPSRDAAESVPPPFSGPAGPVPPPFSGPAGPVPRVADPYARAAVLLDDGRTLVFRDVRRFGRVAVVRAGLYTAIPTLASLGPEPLSDDFDPEAFAAALARTRAPVKPYLLSQRPVAGVGNIYADEALWLARIHPLSRRVGRRRAFALHTAIRDVLAAAIDREGTTFRDYVMVNGESGRNATFLIAYGRGGHPCPRCGTALRKIVLGGRGTTYCPACQRH
jgi:formamidopyrimidine-DNA glycosylase